MNKQNYVKTKIWKKGKTLLAVLVVLALCTVFLAGCGAKVMTGSKVPLGNSPDAHMVQAVGSGEKAEIEKHIVSTVPKQTAAKKICTNPYCYEPDCDDWDCDDDDRNIRTCTNPYCLDNDCDDAVCDETYADMLEEQREDRLEALGYDD